MKKLLLISIVALSLASCKKNKADNCYHCTFGTINGVTPEPAEYCGDMPHVFTDSQGNPLSSYCVPK